MNTRRRGTVLWVIACVVAAEGCAKNPGRVAGPRATPASADHRSSMDTYYLGTCAVCDGLLGAKGDSPEVVHEGRSLRVCSDSCAKTLAGAPAACLDRIDQRMIADQRPLYPVNVSLITGRALGARPVDFIWGNRLFRAADAAERDRILTDPARFTQALNRAVIDAQSPTYGMPDKCPVQGDILPSDIPLDIVVANRMVRVCCARCARAVRARPYQYLGMVEYANRHPQKGQHP